MRYVKSLFSNVQKQKNMLKISLLLKKFTNFTGKITREFSGLRTRNFQGNVHIFKSALVYL